MAEKTLAQTLAALRKNDSELRVGSLADFDMNVRAFSTGNISLDSAIGVGGIPRGRVTELFGPSQSGKTTAALGTAAVQQQRVLAGEDEGAILYLDYEYSLDETYCTALGLDVNDESTFIYVQPKSLEQGAQVFRDLASSKHLSLCITDSVAAMVTKKELEADSGAVMVADRAKMMTQLLRQSKGMLHRTQSSLILLNHMLDYIETGPTYGRPVAKRTYTPGGAGIGFYSDVRIQFMPGANVRTKQVNSVTQEEENLQTATQVTAKVVKNKVSLPQRLAHLQVRYGKGFSQPYSVYHAIRAHKAIRVNKATNEIPADLSPTDEATTIIGAENVIRLLETSPETLRKWESKANLLISTWNASKETADVDYDPRLDPETGEIREEIER